MRNARVWGLAGLAIAAVGAAAFAQTTVEPVPEAAPVQAAPLVIDWNTTSAGNAAAGEAKAAVCVACHSVDGNSVAPMYPRLAGQSERYISQQIALVASGQRTAGAVVAMVPFVQDLSLQDMRDLGAFFASQQGGAGVADDSVIAEGAYKGMRYYEVGQRLFRGGDAARGVPACVGCHGPAGEGNPGSLYPRIGGQHQDYVTARLQNYQLGETAETDRKQFDIMAQIAKPLSAEEITALATYLQGLHQDAQALAMNTTP
jgi:cytochrome c553